MRVFIIAPFKSDPDFEKKKDLVLRLAASKGIDVIFATNENTQANTELSLSSLDSCNLVIADLSFERPSCYFEVGYAQAKDKRIFIIALENTTIHQVKLRNNIHYYKNLEEYEQIMKKIMKKDQEIETGAKC